MFYERNPFSGGEDEKWRNSYTREMFNEENQKMRQGTLKEMNKKVRMTLLGIVGVIGIMAITEGFIRLYEKNRGVVKQTDTDKKNK